MFGGKKTKVAGFEQPSIFRPFFEIRDVRDDSVIGLDGSLHAVLDAGEGLPFYTFSEKKRRQVVEGYEAFLKDLNFDIQIVARTVNDRMESRLKLLESRLSYIVKQKEDKSLLKKYEQFSEWLRNYVEKNCRPARKYYVVIPFNVELSSGFKEAEFSCALDSLKERVVFVQKRFAEFGMRNVVRLDSGQLQKLFDSYVEDAVYTGKGYLTPAAWVKEFEALRK